MERTRKLGVEELLYDCKRSLKLCLGAQGRKAKAKSRDEDGEQGVTMIAGRGDLPATSSKERSDFFRYHRLWAGNESRHTKRCRNEDVVPPLR